MKRRLASLGLALFLASCREKGDPVRQTLDRVAKAAADRDAAAVAAELSADYRDDSGNGRGDIERTLRGYFAGYESVEVALRDVAIERAESAARARFRADITGKPRRAVGLASLLPSRASYRFDVRLVPEGGGWKIAWASWEVSEK